MLKIVIRFVSYIFIFLAHICIQAQVPVLKVDLNVTGRQEAEVNEPGYYPWPMTGAGSKTIEGITFEFKNGTVDDGWYKAGVQAPYYARLVEDGFSTDKIELHISGLQNGKHSLVTFHNAYDNPANNVFPHADIYVNEVLAIDDLEPSERALSNDDGATAFLMFDINNNEPVVIRFQSDPKLSSTTNLIYICGFHLNSSDPKKMAKFEYPEDKDEHVDIDNDTLVFRWKSPTGAVSHNFYFGTDETALLTAGTGSPEFVGNIADTFFVKTSFYSMDNYYWRVDPIDSGGDTTKGDVWYFKKRIRAFPEAEGYGSYAIGGRGGKVVYVTNLDDSGQGSFRYAVENETGPRTILFAVSGLITLKDRLVIRDDYITVAGQTAPGKGICFRWAPIGVTGDDLIVQNLRSRVGYGITYDGMGLTGANHSIVDHCSVSWSIDEGFSSRGAKNITLQRTLISEALNMADHDIQHSEHGYAGSIGGDVGSFHHVLLAHCNGRNWSMAGGLDGDGYYAGRLDLFNMVVYNWGSRATDGGAHEVNFVNNYYKKGVSTTQTTILKADLEGTGKGSQSYYFSGNIVENTNGTLVCDGTDNTCSRTYTTSNGQVVDWEVFVDEPFFPSMATIHSAKDAYKLVLSNVGCTQPALDDHDIRIIHETLNGTYTCKGSVTGKAGFPDREWDVGSWEAYPGYVRSVKWDTDHDGLPDWWEKVHGLDPNSTGGDFSESNADPDKDGYTILEEYLHWMDMPHYFIKTGENNEIDLSMHTRGFTNNPEFMVSDVENGNANIDAGSSIVHFSPATEGMAGFEFTVTDAEGSSMSRKIGFYAGEVPADSMFTYDYQLRRDGSTMVTVDSVNHVAGPQTVKDIGNLQDIYHLNIYPNPVGNSLYVNFGSRNHTSVKLKVLNILGKVICENRYETVHGANSLVMDLHHLKPGVYVLNVENNGYIRIIRFIKQ